MIGSRGTQAPTVDGAPTRLPTYILETQTWLEHESVPGAKVIFLDTTGHLLASVGGVNVNAILGT